MAHVVPNLSSDVTYTLNEESLNADPRTHEH